MKINKRILIIAGLGVVIVILVILIFRPKATTVLGKMPEYFNNDNQLSSVAALGIARKFGTSELSAANKKVLLVAEKDINPQVFVDLEGVSQTTVIGPNVTRYSDELKKKFILVNTTPGAQTVLYQSNSGSLLGQFDCTSPQIPEAAAVLLSLKKTDFDMYVTAIDSSSCKVEIYQQMAGSKVFHNGYKPLCTMKVENKAILEYQCQLKEYVKESEVEVSTESLAKKLGSINSQKDNEFGFVSQYNIGCVDESCIGVEQLDYAQVINNQELDKKEVVYAPYKSEKQILLLPAYFIRVKGNLASNNKNLLPPEATYTYLFFAVAESHFTK